jgi:hypothetical protein
MRRPRSKRDRRRHAEDGDKYVVVDGAGVVALAGAAVEAAGGVDTSR